LTSAGASDWQDKEPACRYGPKKKIGVEEIILETKGIIPEQLHSFVSIKNVPGEA